MQKETGRSAFEPTPLAPPSPSPSHATDGAVATQTAEATGVADSALATVSPPSGQAASTAVTAAAAADPAPAVAAAAHAARGVPAAPEVYAHDIFISYAWKPEEELPDGRKIYYGQRRAHTLALALRRAGYTVWLDTDSMAKEQTHCVWGAMATGIVCSQAVVFCVSPEYRDSHTCQTEAQFVHDARKKHRFIVK